MTRNLNYLLKEELINCQVSLSHIFGKEPMTMYLRLNVVMFVCHPFQFRKLKASKIGLFNHWHNKRGAISLACVSLCLSVASKLSNGLTVFDLVFCLKDESVVSIQENRFSHMKIISSFLVNSRFFFNVKYHYSILIVFSL